LVFVSSAQAAGVNLAPRFEAGTVAYYVSESIIRHDVSADLLDSDETVTLKSDTGMSLRVAAVDSNGVAEVIWTQHYVGRHRQRDHSRHSVSRRLRFPLARVGHFAAGVCLHPLGG
jgi:hypothetical protein